MSTPASRPTPPWDATEPLPPASDGTRPLPPAETAAESVTATAEPYADSRDVSGARGARSTAETTPRATAQADQVAQADQAAHSAATAKGQATTDLPSVGSTRVLSREDAVEHRALPPVGRPEGLADRGGVRPADRASRPVTGGDDADGLGQAPTGENVPPGGHVPAIREWRMLSPKTLFFGALDLVVDAALNTALLCLIGALLVAGVTTVPALGLGVLVLAATVYVMVAAVWLERRRSASSFGLDIRDPQRRRTPRTDWVRIPHQIWLDASDGSLWLGMLHLTITCLLGWLMLVPFVVAGAGIAAATTPLYMPADSVVRTLMDQAGDVPPWALVAGSVLAVVLGILLGVLLTLAHRGLSAGLLRQSEAARLRREAMESERRAEYESAAKESAVRGAETERSRIERDLHDGVQPQLVSVAMNLSMAKSKIDTDPAAAKELVAEAHGTTKAAITELRRLARGFHPAVLEDRGLDAALSAVAAQAPFPVDVAVTVPRLDPRTEAAVYFAVSESLTNAVKHSGARSADVAVSVQDGPAPGTRVVVAGVRDSGRGGAQVVPGGGLSGIRDRIRSAGGRFFVNSPAGGPTEVIVELPLGSTGEEN
ncbi:sensor histidine kinase [Kocuria tytonicola]|uniref:sensor histidine kinase n=1 Tax=Kocuria tytonicola TaxID=2055946 RepID=UPI001F0C5E56|nr:sensor histidine kinase [Kocuria tytonicola]